MVLWTLQASAKLSFTVDFTSAYVMFWGIDAARSNKTKLKEPRKKCKGHCHYASEQWAVRLAKAQCLVLLMSGCLQ